MKRATVWMLTAWALGCGARERVSRPVVAPVAVSAAVAQPAPTEVRFLSQLDARLRYATDPTGPERAVVGGVRVERDAAGVRVARQAVLGAFLSAIDLGGAWVFVSSDGRVARADSFLGDLTLLGAACGREALSRHTRGRLAIPCGDRVFLTDGRTLTTAGATPSRVRTAAFSDALRGAASLRDGSLVTTADGGATWRPVALGDDVCVGVEFRDGALRVSTAVRTATLSADGTLTAVPASERRESWHDAERARREVYDEAVSAVRAAVERELAVTSVTLADGSSLQVDGQSVLHRAADGAELSRSTFSARPHLRGWGSAALVFAERVYQTRDGEVFTLVAPPEGVASWRFRRDDLVLSNDGVHMVVPYGCDREHDSETERGAMCVLTDGATRWQEFSGDDSAPRTSAPYAMHEGLILVGGCREGGCDTRVLDSESGRTWSPAIAGAEGGLNFSTVLRWTSEGALVGVACRGDCEGEGRWFVRGEPFAPLAASPMPDGVERVRFADRRRGIAIGRTARSLWRTLDGGRTWEPVSLPVEGEMLVWRPNSETRCDDRGCVIDGVVAIDGWGPLRAPSRTAFNILVPPPDPHARDAEEAPTPARPTLSPLELRCEEEGVAPDAPWALSSSEGADLSLARWPEGILRSIRADRSVTYEWRGERVRAGRLTYAVDDPERWGYPDVLGAGARGVVLGVRGELLVTWAGPRAPVIRLGDTFENLSPGISQSSAALLPLPSGGVAVAAATYAGAEQVTLIFEIGANGALGGRRVFARDDSTLMEGVGVIHGQVSRVTFSARGVVASQPLSGGTVETLATLSSPLRICTDAEVRAATLPMRVRVDYGASTPIRFDNDRWGYESKLVDLVVTRSGVCVSAISPRSQAPFVTLRASRSALRGYFEDPRGRVGMRCEVSR